MFAADIDAGVMSALNDGLGSYLDAAGVPRVQNVELIVDHNLQRVGPNGVLVSDALGITWQNTEIKCVERGGIFLFDGKRYLVEEIISDDGDFSTAACMEDV